MKEYTDLFNPYFLSKTKEQYVSMSPLPENPVTTMAYVPFQTNTQTYEPSVALQQGTLYPDLDKPFLGSRMMKK